MADNHKPILRVFLAVANASGYAALDLVFRQLEGVRVAGGAADTISAQTYLNQYGADLLLIDWDLPVKGPHDGRANNQNNVLTVANLLQSTRSLNKQISMIVLTLKPEIEAAALSAGANCVLWKSTPPQKMRAVLIEQVSILRSRLHNMPP